MPCEKRQQANTESSAWMIVIGAPLLIGQTLSTVKLYYEHTSSPPDALPVRGILKAASLLYLAVAGLTRGRHQRAARRRERGAPGRPRLLLMAL